MKQWRDFAFLTWLLWFEVPVTDFEGHTQHVRLCKIKITMCAAYLQPWYTAEGGGRRTRAGVFYMMLFSVTFLKNSQQTMCRYDEKLRSLYSFFNLDGCVYYLTKKDHTTTNEIVCVTSCLSRVLGRKNMETEMRCCCMRTACLKTDTATYLWLEVTLVDR